MFLNSRSSATSQRAAIVGVDSEQKSNFTARGTKPSSRSRSAASVKPHQAGDAIVSLASAVAWKMACSAGGGKPWARRVRRANSAFEKAANVSVTWAVIDRLCMRVTPSLDPGKALHSRWRDDDSAATSRSNEQCFE
jgi:hypothetical protein